MDQIWFKSPFRSEWINYQILFQLSSWAFSSTCPPTLVAWSSNSLARLWHKFLYNNNKQQINRHLDSNHLDKAKQLVFFGDKFNAKPMTLISLVFQQHKHTHTHTGSQWFSSSHCFLSFWGPQPLWRDASWLQATSARHFLQQSWGMTSVFQSDHSVSRAGWSILNRDEHQWDLLLVWLVGWLDR